MSVSKLPLIHFEYKPGDSNYIWKHTHSLLESLDIKPKEIIQRSLKDVIFVDWVFYNKEQRDYAFESYNSFVITSPFQSHARLKEKEIKSTETEN